MLTCIPKYQCSARYNWIFTERTNMDTLDKFVNSWSRVNEAWSNKFYAQIFHDTMRNNKVKFNPNIYTLSKLSSFGNEISVLNTQQGGIQNNRRSHRLIRHGNGFMEEWMSNFFLGTVHLIFWGGGAGIFWKKNSLPWFWQKKINLLNGTVKKIICLQ